jgi:sirohydrochlorin cobaltochelatase
VKTLIVLASHGSPPNDFPPAELAEFFGLQGRLEHAHGHVPPEMEQRYEHLKARVLTWPRTESNDPFWAATNEMAKALQQASGSPVLVGFNEFCAPTLDEVLSASVKQGATHIIVVTPMLTRGGEHAEKDIPAAIHRAERDHPAVVIRYVWPFPMEDVARFLATQIARAPDVNG